MLGDVRAFKNKNKNFNKSIIISFDFYSLNIKKNIKD